MKRIFRRNQIIITTLAVMIAAAGYLNYSSKKEVSGAEVYEAGMMDISDSDILAENQAKSGVDDGSLTEIASLDGDGEEEALAFFRNSADEKPLKIYIFTAGKQGYEQAAVIEGTGTSIYSIAYEDLDQDGRKELLVGWRVNTDLLALSV